MCVFVFVPHKAFGDNDQNLSDSLLKQAFGHKSYIFEPYRYDFESQQGESRKSDAVTNSKAIGVWSKLSLGVFSTLLSEEDPASRLGVKPSTEEEDGLWHEFILGMDPALFKSLRFYSYYTYSQNWLSNPQRMSDSLEPIGDFEYDPFRADLLQRKHKLLASLDYQTNSALQWGLLVEHQIDKIGTSYIIDPEQYEGYQVVEPLYGYLALPWVLWGWNNHQRTQLYLHFYKEINHYSNDQSFQSYSTLEPKHLSLGLNHRAFLPDFKVALSAHLTHYTYIFNDPWLDRTRNGLFLSMAYEFLPQISMETQFLSYNEKFLLPRLKVGGCETFHKKSPTGESILDLKPVLCERIDIRTAYLLKLRWHHTPYQDLSFSYHYQDNKNPILREFDYVSKTFFVDLTLSFPNNKKTRDLTQRFYDENIYTR